MTNYFTKIGLSLAVMGLALTSGVHAKDTDKASKGGALEKQMVGHWAPHPEKMIEAIKKEMGDDPNAAAMLPMIQAMLANMVAEVKAGEVTFYVMGESKKSTYVITGVDKEAGKLTMKVKEDGEEEEVEGSIVIKGDELILAKEDEKSDLVLNRITKAEFEKRKGAQKAPGLPGGIPAPPQ